MSLEFYTCNVILPTSGFKQKSHTQIKATHICGNSTVSVKPIDAYVAREKHLLCGLAAAFGDERPPVESLWSLYNHVRLTIHNYL